MVSVFRAAWAAVRTWGLLVVELEREKDTFSLISPIGVVAGATSTPAGGLLTFSRILGWF